MSVTSTAARPSVLFSAAEALAAARAYAASIADGVIERDRAGEVPYAELAALDASGLLGITVPAAHGGPDLSPVVLAEVIATIAAVDPAIAQIPQAHFLFVDVLAVYGSPGQQERLFADVLAGARLGNGLAERGGQHAQDLKTRLRRGPGRDLRLDGRKYCADAFAVPQQLGARSQLVHAAIQAGIARGALRDAGEFVRTKARPFFEAARAGWADTAAADPHTIHRFGRLATRVRAADTMLAAAAATLEEVTRFPRDAAAAARGSIAVAQAKAFASDVAVEVASDLFALAGASAADERHDLSRHWRNARTHASHDPVDWKYHHVGNFLLNHVPPPNHGQV